jgi:PIN like domain
LTSSNQQPSSSITLLLDRTHQAKITARLLRELNVSVEVHKRYYLPEEPDPSWIADSTGRGWVIISGDKGLEYDGINRQAVETVKAKVFLLTDTESRGAEWAAALVLARHKIIKIATENEGPFYCTVEKGRDDHVGLPRFLKGGGPLQKPARMSEAQIPTPEPSETKSSPEPIPTSGLLEFTTRDGVPLEAVDPSEEIMMEIESRKKIIP